MPRVSCTAVRGAGHNKWSNIKHIKAERDGQLAKVSRLMDNNIHNNVLISSTQKYALYSSKIALGTVSFN